MPTHVPRFDAIDYWRPAAYAVVSSSFAGDTSVVQQLAERRRGNSPEATLGNVWRWIRDHLKADRDQGDYHWRTASEILMRGGTTVVRNTPSSTVHWHERVGFPWSGSRRSMFPGSGSSWRPGSSTAERAMFI